MFPFTSELSHDFVVNFILFWDAVAALTGLVLGIKWGIAIASDTIRNWAHDTSPLSWERQQPLVPLPPKLQRLAHLAFMPVSLAAKAFLYVLTVVAVMLCCALYFGIGGLVFGFVVEFFGAYIAAAVLVGMSIVYLRHHTGKAKYLYR